MSEVLCMGDDDADRILIGAAAMQRVAMVCVVRRWASVRCGERTRQRHGGAPHGIVYDLQREVWCVESGGRDECSDACGLLLTRRLRSDGGRCVLALSLAVGRVGRASPA